MPSRIKRDFQPLDFSRTSDSRRAHCSASSTPWMIGASPRPALDFSAGNVRERETVTAYAEILQSFKKSYVAASVFASALASASLLVPSLASSSLCSRSIAANLASKNLMASSLCITTAIIRGHAQRRATCPKISRISTSFTTALIRLAPRWRPSSRPCWLRGMAKSGHRPCVCGAFTILGRRSVTAKGCRARSPTPVLCVLRMRPTGYLMIHRDFCRGGAELCRH